MKKRNGKPSKTEILAAVCLASLMLTAPVSVVSGQEQTKITSKYVKVPRKAMFWRGDWKEKVKYYLPGDVVLDGGDSYVCLVKHISVNAPSTDPTKWKLLASSIYWTGEWNVNLQYMPGDGVQHGGSSYLCIKNHTSSADTAPPNATYWDLLAAAGTSGITGTTGPQGPTGNRGPDGATGPQGETGAEGAKGPTGDRGPIGATGLRGATGPTGAQGPTGNKGPNGTTGNRGPIGETGPDGNQGPDGTTGPQGPTGAEGAKGPTGDRGPIGQTGPDGNRGPIGETGIRGEQGETGPIGIQGPTGNKGPNGTTGPQGGTGVRGPQGQTGPDGNRGPIGETGIRGEQGPTGIGLRGATGPTGAQGLQGITGTTGAKGATGTTGAQGVTGDRGATGPTGAQGIQGITGATGAKGATGTTGATGPGIANMACSAGQVVTGFNGNLPICSTPPVSGYLIFVSSLTYSGNLSGFSGADAKCQSLAEAAGLSGTFRALLSSNVTNARERADVAVGPYTLVDRRTIVSLTYGGLFGGSINAAVNMDETGQLQTGIAYTGTAADGIGGGNGTHCSNWASTISSAYTGNITATDRTWITSSPSTSPCSNLYHIYCFQRPWSW